MGTDCQSVVAPTSHLKGHTTSLNKLVVGTKEVLLGLLLLHGVMGTDCQSVVAPTSHLQGNTTSLEQRVS